MLEFNYVKVVIGSHANYVIRTLDEAEIMLLNATDAYRGLYHFTEDYYLFWKEHGSVSGYEGDHAIDMIWWDVDNKDSIFDAQTATEKLISRLQDHGVTAIQAWFSGKKGFHIEVPVQAFAGSYFDPGPDLYKRVEAFCLGVAQEITGANIDNIYALNHHLRSKWSYRSDGEQKIPVQFTQDGFMPLNYERPLGEFDAKQVDPCKIMNAYAKPIQTPVERKQDVDRKCSETIKILGAMVTENRHTAMTMYISVLKKKHFTQPEILVMTKAWNRALVRENGEVNEITDESIDRVVSSMCKRKYKSNETKLPKPLVRLDSVVPEPWKGDLSTGTILDHQMDGGLMSGGKIHLLMGLPGVGKTQIGLAFSVSIAKSGNPVVYLSEMSAGVCAHRTKGKVDGLPIFIEDSSDWSVGDLDYYYESCDPKPKIIVIDHVRLIVPMTPTGLRFADADQTAVDLHTFARSSGVSLLELSHITGPRSITEKPNMMDVRDSKTFTHFADVQFSVYRSADLKWANLSVEKWRHFIPGKDKISLGRVYSIKMEDIL